jgi:hypothetical protein
MKKIKFINEKHYVPQKNVGNLIIVYSKAQIFLSFLLLLSDVVVIYLILNK